MSHRAPLFLALITAFMIAAPVTVFAAERPTAAQIEFFESKIRPVLVEHCYDCHNSSKLAEGNFAADSREAFLKGGNEGAIIVPGKPAESLLLPILRHEVEGIKMPKNGGKLDAQTIADFEKWISMGAPDPRDQPPSAAELARDTSWETVRNKRQKWWSFQPIRKISPPTVPNNEWSEHPIDRFILAKLREKKLVPAQPADPETLVRRLYFTLIGLPPKESEVALWVRHLREPKGVDHLIDHLLASPHFGEHWARHWMDWIRYADSHGSEGDPAIDNGWYFRDYLIRALNADVPYDQLVREQIAGDLLQHPRINQGLGINESLIGPAHWRMVFHGFAPTDALDEKVRFIDDEINTFSKAFLGLTVSCARCHDHKFDPISQKDYYALFGILGSCRPGRVAIDIPAKLNANRQELAALKTQIRDSMAQEWLAAAPRLRDQLMDEGGVSTKADHVATRANGLLNPLYELRKAVASGTPFAAAWQNQVAGWTNHRRLRDEHAQRKYWKRWDLARPADYATWFRDGTALSEKPSSAGEFAVAMTGENALQGIYPGGAYSHRLSAKYPARLSSDYVRLDGNYDLWLRVIGDGGAAARYVVQDYPRNGTVFPVTQLSPEWTWQKFDLTYWNGDDIHIELTAGKDAPLMVNGSPRSWFGIQEAVIVKQGDPAPVDPHDFLAPLFESSADTPPQSLKEVADRYESAVVAAINAWKANTIDDAQASLLNACLRQGLLPNQVEELTATKPLIATYRQLEEAIAVPTRVPGLEETVGRDQPLMVRGNHKQLGEVVPRRFLEAIDATPYQTTQSGRLQLADDLLRDRNPLTRRVIVNRLWHHVFGQGLVSTPDNFGRLGQEPTHPELLDYLASEFKERGWSIKDAIRSMVSSKTWQMTYLPSSEARQQDPENQFLSHAHIRRLEAEAIRDSLMAVSGRLERDLFGLPVDGNATRRSIYIRVQRNALNPFLRAFDFPEPFSTTGRRDVTNVPAQSLTLLNDPQVASLAGDWASKLLANKELGTDDARIHSLFTTAFGRAASTAEVADLKSYLAQTKTNQRELVAHVGDVREQMEQRELAVRGLLEPTRKRLIDQAKAKIAAGEQLVPKPISRWEFETDLQDAIGTAHGTAFGGGRIDGGSLVVGSQGYAVTAPIKQPLKAKTLETWVQLSDLKQSGGGVMTVQSPDGVIFDSIVFAEQSPQQWLSGSDNFSRTQSFQGPAEQDAVEQPVHLAIVYHENGLVVGYRNGQPYGKPYQSNGPHEFKADTAVVSFGIRHLPAGGNRMLSGRILRAQLYDRALTADEIQATSQSVPYFIPEAQVLAALSVADRESLAGNRKIIQQLQAELESLGTVPDLKDDHAAWIELARALFTMKEFIYVK